MIEVRGALAGAGQAMSLALSAMADAPRVDATGEAPLADLVAALAATRMIANQTAALQARLVARLAATTTSQCEDGTLIHLPGSAGSDRLDAAALVAGPLRIGQLAAARRIGHAEQLTGVLSPVLEAMTEGALDERRAAIICDELAAVDDDTATVVAEQLAREVMAALDADPCSETAAPLKRHTRRVLAGIDPDHVAEQAALARSRRSLRRFPDQPGVDIWEARLSVQDSAPAWAAIDELAQQLRSAARREGAPISIEQARADALLALIHRQATISTTVQVTIPFLDVDAERELPAATELQAAPELPVAPELPAAAELQAAPELSAALDALGAAADHVVTVTGLGRAEPSEVTAGWARATVAKALSIVDHAPKGIGSEPMTVTVTPCHRVTGALLDPRDELATDAYRPSPSLVAFVRARDGHCRFPGCSINARFCDLDHVRPWPTGPTSGANLLSLCRRHHRVKQLPGWLLHLASDGAATWTTPIGDHHLTLPLDHRGTALRSTEPRATGSRGAEPQGAEPQGAEPRAAEPSPDGLSGHARSGDKGEAADEFTPVEHHLDHLVLDHLVSGCRTAAGRSASSGHGLWRAAPDSPRTRRCVDLASPARHVLVDGEWATVSLPNDGWDPPPF